MADYEIKFEAKTPKKGQKTYVLIGKVREKVEGDPVKFDKTPAVRIFKGDKWSYSVGQIEEEEFEKVGGNIPSSVKPWEESTRLWNKLKAKLKEVGIKDPESVLKKISASLEREHFEIRPRGRGKKSEEPFKGSPHPGGGITDQIVYEPIGAGKYAYRTADGEKGIAEAGAEKIKESGIETTLHYLDFGDKRWFFEEGEEPLKKPLFDPVSEEVVEEWVEGKREAPSVKELWERSLTYYKSFLDMPREAEYNFMVLQVFQSWIAELLPIVFYLGIQGEFGGGKTVSGEAVILPCRHGFQTGNTSPSFVARGIERQKLTIFTDELDSTSGGDEDNALYQVFRQGYRRGLKYTRSAKDDPDRLQSFEVFGAKLFTAHSSVETALRTRTIPLHSRETDDVKYPVVNVDKLSLGERLKEGFFLWWMDNALGLKSEKFEAVLPVDVDQVDYVDQIVGRAPSQKDSQGGKHSEAGPHSYNWSTKSTRSTQIGEIAEELREKLYERKKRILEEDQIEKLKESSARNAELMYQIFALSNLLGVNIDEDIAKVFEQKKAEEREEREIGMVGILRDMLVEKYHDKKNDPDFKTEDGRVKIANKEIYDDFNERLKDEDLSGVSPHKFKEYLTELGFSDVTNRKKLKVRIPDESEPQSRMCNIFDGRVLRKLGIEETPTAGPSQKEIVEKLLDLYSEYGDPERTVAWFLDVAEGQFENASRGELKPHVLRLKRGGEITLREDGETRGGGGNDDGK